MAEYRACVVTVSDSCYRGEREDLSGRRLAELLSAAGVEVKAAVTVPDEVDAIVETLRKWCKEVDLILTTGGTGFAPRDVTPEATAQVIERAVPGIPELLRWTGYQKNPRAVLSRGTAGICGRTLIINFPGSPKGVEEGFEVVSPLLAHAMDLIIERPIDH
jgi:molybdenum cofactor synthesis domain-containing protein